MMRREGGRWDLIEREERQIKGGRSWQAVHYVPRQDTVQVVVVVGLPCLTRSQNTKSGRGVEHDHTFRRIQMTTSTTTDYFCRLLTALKPPASWLTLLLCAEACVCYNLYH